MRGCLVHGVAACCLRLGNVIECVGGTLIIMLLRIIETLRQLNKDLLVVTLSTIESP